MLVQNLDRLNDNVREESDGIHNTLSVIENLVRWYPGLLRQDTDLAIVSFHFSLTVQIVSLTNNL